MDDGRWVRFFNHLLEWRENYDIVKERKKIQILLIIEKNHCNLYNKILINGFFSKIILGQQFSQSITRNS